MHWKHYLIPVLILSLLGTWFFSSSGIVHAAGNQGYQYTAVTGTLYPEYERAGISCWYPVECAVANNYDVSSSYSVTVGLSIAIINATVGFNVQYSSSSEGQCYYTPPPGDEGWVQVFANYYEVTFNIYYHNSVTGTNTYQGYGSGQKWIGDWSCESEFQAPGGGT